MAVGVISRGRELAILESVGILCGDSAALCCDAADCVPLDKQRKRVRASAADGIEAERRIAQTAIKKGVRSLWDDKGLTP